MINSKQWLLGLLTLLILMSNKYAIAFQLSPAVAKLEAEGAKSEQIYLLTNNASAPAAIQFKILTRQQRTDGSENRNPAQHLFSINPQQVVIPSGGTQKVRVRWLGGNKIPREQAYRFVAQQLPIALTPADSYSIQITFTMEGALYIKPSGSTGSSLSSTSRYRPQPGQSAVRNPDQTQTQAPMLQVKKVALVNTPEGKRLALTIHNPSPEHMLLAQVSIRLSAPGKMPLNLRGDQLGNLLNQNLLAGATRNFMLPLPQGFDAQGQWNGKVLATP